MKIIIFVHSCFFLMFNITFTSLFADEGINKMQKEETYENSAIVKNEILDMLINTLNKLEELDDKEIMAELNKNLDIIEKLKDEGQLSVNAAQILKKNVVTALNSAERKELVKTVLIDSINNVQTLSGDLIKILAIGTIISIGSITLLSQCMKIKGSWCGVYSSVTIGMVIGFGFGIGIMK